MSHQRSKVHADAPMSASPPGQRCLFTHGSKPLTAGAKVAGEQGFSVTLEATRYPRSGHEATSAEEQRGWTIYDLPVPNERGGRAMTFKRDGVKQGSDVGLDSERDHP